MYAQPFNRTRNLCLIWGSKSGTDYERGDDRRLWWSCNNNNNNNNNFISRGWHIWHECQSNIWSSFTQINMSLMTEQEKNIYRAFCERTIQPCSRGGVCDLCRWRCIGSLFENAICIIFTWAAPFDILIQTVFYLFLFNCVVFSSQ